MENMAMTSARHGYREIASGPLPFRCGQRIIPDFFNVTVGSQQEDMDEAL